MTVDYATVNGSAIAGNDYVSKSGTVTFAPGTTSKSISIAILGDTALESNETFEVRLSNPRNAQINDGKGIGTIRNDDTVAPQLPTLFAGQGAVTEGDDGSEILRVTVTLSEAHF